MKHVRRSLSNRKKENIKKTTSTKSWETNSDGIKQRNPELGSKTEMKSPLKVMNSLCKMPANDTNRYSR